MRATNSECRSCHVLKVLLVQVKFVFHECINICIASSHGAVCSLWGYHFGAEIACCAVRDLAKRFLLF